VLLRIEDHDRQRSRPEYESALLDDLDALGLAADEPSTDDLRRGPSGFRQSDVDRVYRASLDGLRMRGLAYACICARSVFEAFEIERGRPWAGPGCPGACRTRGIRDEDGVGIRIALGVGREVWVDLLEGAMSDDVVPTGDPLARDRNGNWTYGFCVVVDDLRHGVDLVIRGRDLLHATAAQIRLGKLLGRERPARFLHHPLIVRPDGSKLSKADGDTALREALAAGRTPAQLFGDAAAAVGLGDGSPIDDPAALFR
jgi:glutamyl/glutaminyl-tRNA synthetase